MTDNRDIPPETGHSAHVLKNGEVHGSGMSTGGGQPGEEYDTDEHGGEGPNPTGVGTRDKATPAQGSGDREPGGL